MNIIDLSTKTPHQRREIVEAARERGARAWLLGIETAPEDVQTIRANWALERIFDWRQPEVGHDHQAT